MSSWFNVGVTGRERGVGIGEKTLKTRKQKFCLLLQLQTAVTYLHHLLKVGRALDDIEATMVCKFL